MLNIVTSFVLEIYAGAAEEIEEENKKAKYILTLKDKFHNLVQINDDVSEISKFTGYSAPQVQRLSREDQRIRDEINKQADVPVTRLRTRSDNIMIPDT